MDVTLIRIVLGLAICFAVYASPSNRYEKPSYEALNSGLKGKEAVAVALEGKLTPDEQELLDELFDAANIPGSSKRGGFRDTIPTYGGTDDAVCVFPFIYEGNTYSSCTTLYATIPWCATTSNYDADGLWKYCIMKDVCSSNPCKNGGTCHRTAGGYRCACAHWIFRGTNCQFKYVSHLRDKA